MKIKVKKVHPDAILPTYGTPGAAGFDLSVIEQVSIKPGETKLIRTGLSFEIPEGYELEIRPRSGVSSKTRLRLSNSPGTIDSDYRGEVMFIIDNIMTPFPAPVTVIKGQRLGQGIIRQVERHEFEEVVELTETKRGEKGLGSTGV